MGASRAMVQPLSRFCGTAAPAADCEELRAKATELREQIQELEDKRLSVLSDSRQAQKRHSTDLENELKYGITKFAKEMLKIADNLERASGSVKQEDLDQDRELRRMHASVGRMKTIVSEALEDFGIRKMEPMDEPFNPEHHEAMFAVPMPGKEPNTVFHVMEDGYTIHDRTLRAARSGVVR